MTNYAGRKPRGPSNFSRRPSGLYCGCATTLARALRGRGECAFTAGEIMNGDRKGECAHSGREIADR